MARPLGLSLAPSLLPGGHPSKYLPGRWRDLGGRDASTGEQTNFSQKEFEMPFAESFAESLRKSGIELSESDVPSEKEVQSGLDGLQSWLDSLDRPTREAADGVTAQFTVKAGLADPEVNVATGLAAVLRAADKAQVTLDISQVLALSRQAFEQSIGGQV
jgi:hypothetical protein